MCEDVRTVAIFAYSEYNTNSRYSRRFFTLGDTWASHRLTAAAVVLVQLFVLLDGHGDADDVIEVIAVLAPDHDARGNIFGAQWTLDPLSGRASG